MYNFTKVCLKGKLLQTLVHSRSNCNQDNTGNLNNDMLNKHIKHKGVDKFKENSNHTRACRSSAAPRAIRLAGACKISARVLEASLTGVDDVSAVIVGRLVR